MSGPRQSPGGSTFLRGIGSTALGVICGFVIIALAAVMAIRFVGGNNSQAAPAPSSAVTSPSTSPSQTTRRIPVPTLDAATLAKLPRATTETTVKGAPVDSSTSSGGDVVEIQRNIPGFAKPGKSPITVIPSKQIGGQTWLPIIARDANWIKVRLPSRPNGATAWIPGDGLRTAKTSWAVHISLANGRMTVTKGGHSVGSWRIGQGKAHTPTPVGQTFLLAGFVDPHQSFSPVIYALGAHSHTLDTFGGGPGTVAVHGWPTESGRLGKVSHGCVRVPDAALKMFAKLPSGTPVDITG